MLPAHPVGAHRVFRRRRQRIAIGEQGIDDVVGIGGLRQIVGRPYLHRGDGRGDGAVAGQHHHARFRAALADRLDHVEPVAVFEPQIDHRVGRRTRRRAGLSGRNRIGGFGIESALFHGSRQAPQKRLVIVNEK